jgi:hypothetical protein
LPTEIHSRPIDGNQNGWDNLPKFTYVGEHENQGEAMKLRTSIALTSAGALIGAGAFMVPAFASARVATHTLTFTSVTKTSIDFSKTTGAQQDTDVNAKGKVVGYDMLYFTIVSKTTGAINITGDTEGGMLYGTAETNLVTGAVFDGKVTGGTGAFKGATGTITAKNLNAAGTRTAVKIVYHT